MTDSHDKEYFLKLFLMTNYDYIMSCSYSHIRLNKYQKEKGFSFPS